MPYGAVFISAVTTSKTHTCISFLMRLRLLASRKDDRSPIQHTIAMARALRHLNKAVEEKQYSDEEHGNYLFENQIDHANRVLEFLDKHIGASSQKAKTN